MSKSWRGLITDSAAHLLRFSMPTHTHDFDNHSNGYGRSKTALVWSVSGLPEIRFFDSFNLETVLESMKITIFKIVVLRIGLGSLIICTHDLFILTKIKEIIHYCESFGYGGNTLSTHVSSVLMQVSSSFTSGTTGRWLRAKILDTTESLQRQTAEEPYTMCQV
jgi:hypothetical protein